MQVIGLDIYLVITDYLTNCMQYVVVNGISSKPPVSFQFQCAPGVCILGSLLFLIYINGTAELPLSPESKLVMYADDILLYADDILLYADDILLYRPIREPIDYQLLQQDVEALGKWTV